MCDVCNNKSGGKYVGVAAVPMAPVSVMWCDNCLKNNAYPRFVVETWLFTEFDPQDPERKEMPEEPLEYPLGDFGTIWLNETYVPIKDAYPQLWREEYERISSEVENERRGIS